MGSREAKAGHALFKIVFSRAEVRPSLGRRKSIDRRVRFGCG